MSVSAHHQDTKIVRGGRTRTDDLLLQRDAQPTELLPLRVNDEQDLNLHTRDAPAALMLAYRPRIRCKQHSDTACVKCCSWLTKLVSQNLRLLSTFFDGRISHQ